MVIPGLVGALAVFLLLAAAVLAIARRGATTLLVGVAAGVAALATGLAIETEARYQACNPAEIVGYTTLSSAAIADAQLSNPLFDEADARSAQYRRCERAPW